LEVPGAYVPGSVVARGGVISYNKNAIIIINRRILWGPYWQPRTTYWL